MRGRGRNISQDRNAKDRSNGKGSYSSDSRSRSPIRKEANEELHKNCISKHDFVHLKQDFEELHRRFVLAQQTSEEQRFSKKMFKPSSGNKNSSSYFLTGSQSGAGEWEEGIHVTESFEWGYMETEDGSMVRVKFYKQEPTHSITDKQEEKLTSKFSNMSLRSVGGSKSNSNPTRVVCLYLC